MIGLRIYIPGELGIRHQDAVTVTESGCENLAPARSPRT
jgi:Xaa-Pro aminopeptidase